MEHVRRETVLARDFERVDVDRALARYREMYGTRPAVAQGSPDVIARYCELAGAAGVAHAHSLRLEIEGIPLVAGILAPGTIVFEGEVDEERMGDW